MYTEFLTVIGFRQKNLVKASLLEAFRDARDFSDKQNKKRV